MAMTTTPTTTTIEVTTTTTIEVATTIWPQSTMARWWVVFGYDEGAGAAWEVALALGPSVMESAVIPAHLYLTTDGRTYGSTAV